MSKKLIRISGVVLVLAMLIAMLVPVAAPVSAGEMAWTTYPTPKTSAGLLVPASDASLFAVAPDGNTMFMWSASNTSVTTFLTVAVTANGAGGAQVITVTDTTGFVAGPALYIKGFNAGAFTVTTPTTLTVTAGIPGAATYAVGSVVYVATASAAKLYKSTDAGKTWSSQGLGTNIPPAGTTPSAIAVSNDYANDQTVAMAFGAAGVPYQVFRSADGGANFSQLGDIGVAAAAGTMVTSLDVGKHYAGGQVFIIGWTTGAFGGGVGTFTTGGAAAYTWVKYVAAGTGWAGAVDVLAVALSPKYLTDNELLAVTTNAAGTILVTKIGADNWSVDVNPGTLYAGPSTSASIAFADDYDMYANNRTFIATTDAGALADVFRVNGIFAQPGVTTSTVTDLNVGGSGSSTDVLSITIKGNVADGTAVIGMPAAAATKSYYATGLNASTVTWYQANKFPRGAGNVNVAFSPTTTDLYAGTDGAGSAFSVSTDKGLNFNAVSFIDASAAPALTIGRYSISGATNYLIMGDIDTVAPQVFLFYTADSGATWKMLYAWNTAPSNIQGLSKSPSFATDNTIYILETARIWRSTDGGSTFYGVPSGGIATFTSISPVDATTFYYTNGAMLYKSGRSTFGTCAGGNIKSFTKISDTLMFVGTNNGDVWQSEDDGLNFTRVGAGSELGAGLDVSLSTDPGYATNKILYAIASTQNAPVVAGNNGIYRWVVGTSVTWEKMKSGPVVATIGTIGDFKGMWVSRDGVIYASTYTNGIAPYRLVNPTAPVAAQTGWQSCGGIVGDASLAGFAASYSIASFSVAQTGTSFAPTNTINAKVTGVQPDATYGYIDRIVSFEDILVAAPEIVGPKGTSPAAVTFSWKAKTSPVTLTYRYDYANDRDFQGGNVSTNTQAISGMANLTPGQGYFWRARVALPLVSRTSAAQAFTVQLGVPNQGLVLNNPAPGASGLAPIRPNFSWNTIQNAVSYELQLADNPFFANPQVKAPLYTTVWAWDKDLANDTTYYWRVRAIGTGANSDWVSGVFTTVPVAAPVATTAPPVINVPAPTVNVPAPKVPTFFDPKSGQYFYSDQELKQFQAQHANDSTTPATPVYIWALIVIGAVLVIAMIVLIARTRRV